MALSDQAKKDVDAEIGAQLGGTGVDKVVTQELRARTSKNLLIEVPDVDLDKTGDQPSYLRLGRFVADDMDPSQATRGGDLVAAVKKVGPGDGWDAASTDPGPRVFEDDWRRRPSGAEIAEDGAAEGAHALTKAERAARSTALLDKTTPSFGWRDHTEGNRVTTTRGDKVEVIGGNFKLVVLGRNPDAGQASGLDFSGGHLQDFDAAPGTVNEIRWEKDAFSGTWRMYEKAVKGEVHTIFHGNTSEVFWGDEQKSYVGVEADELPSELKDAVAGMADLGEGVARTKPNVTEKIRARKIVSETFADRIEEKVTVSGAGEDGVSLSHLHATTVVDILQADANFTEVVAATTHAITDNSALVVEVVTGARVSTQLGAFAEICVGAKVEINIGPRKSLGTEKFDLNLQEEKFVVQDDFLALDAKFVAVTDHAAAIQSVEQKISATQTAVKRVNNAVTSNFNSIKQNWTAAATTLTAAQVHLGI